MGELPACLSFCRTSNRHVSQGSDLPSPPAHTHAAPSLLQAQIWCKLTPIAMVSLNSQVLKGKYCLKKNKICTIWYNRHILCQLQTHREKFRWLLLVLVVGTTHQVMSEERPLSHSTKWYRVSSRTKVPTVPALLQSQIRCPSPRQSIPPNNKI